MTQPPGEPPPEHGWQPPGPPPPDPPPPQYPAQYPSQYPSQPNPYGGAQQVPYRPIDSGGMSPTVKIVLGAVIGLFGGFFLWFVAAVVSIGVDFLLFAAV